LIGDGDTLFTIAGMQPLIPYFSGAPHPSGRRLVDYQRCLRTVDIDEVGDASHLTCFEMLSNNVFIAYEQLPDGEIRPLAQRNVDVGLGLERITSLLRGGGLRLRTPTSSRGSWERSAAWRAPAPCARSGSSAITCAPAADEHRQRSRRDPR
jgi:tRNA synthetases class II (A)